MTPRRIKAALPSRQTACGRESFSVSEHYSGSGKASDKSLNHQKLGCSAHFTRIQQNAAGYFRAQRHPFSWLSSINITPFNGKCKLIVRNQGIFHLTPDCSSVIMGIGDSRAGQGPPCFLVHFASQDCKTTSTVETNSRDGVDWKHTSRVFRLVLT